MTATNEEVMDLQNAILEDELRSPPDLGQEHVQDVVHRQPIGDHETATDEQLVALGVQGDDDDLPWPADLAEEGMLAIKAGYVVEPPVRLRAPWDPPLLAAHVARFKQGLRVRRHQLRGRGRGAPARRTPRPRSSRPHVRGARQLSRIGQSPGDPAPPPEGHLCGGSDGRLVGSASGKRPS